MMKPDREPAGGDPIANIKFDKKIIDVGNKLNLKNIKNC